MVEEFFLSKNKTITLQLKKLFNNLFFPENSIQKLIQKFEIGLIQFNKIFIQLENQGIAHH